MPYYNNILDALEKQKENMDHDILIPDDTPIIIPVFNTPTYLRSMISQLEERGWTNIIICDNNSTYQPMLNLLDELSNKYDVVLWGKNLGPRVYVERKEICSKMPKYFILTDPDLVLNPDMPKTAIKKMRRIVDMYGASKVGLAIDIHSVDERERFFNPDQVDEWESQYWTVKVDQYPEKDDLYAAPIDTTFALYNRDRFLSEIDYVDGRASCNTTGIRIAGRFTCKHMGWWANQPLSKEEHEYYKNTHEWSSTENEKKRLGY